MKADERRVEVIENFLAEWKKMAREYYVALRDERREMSKKKYDVSDENLKRCKRYSYRDYREVRLYSDEKVAEILNGVKDGTFNKWDIEKVENEICRQYMREWVEKHTKVELLVLDNCYNDELLDKMLDREVENKRSLLFDRIEKKAGKVVDAAGLYIGHDGNINGVVVGENKTVRVTTIYAGGYNIQCLHYRILVK
jgi:glucan phosphorylase